ncbi:MAG: acyl-CoA dehydrogenase family protein, partial [Acidimicrobiales bacterium]
PTTASVAKALAGRGARTAARHCQQVLAGIGFTTEHEFHLYARRVLVLDELFGSSRSLTRELGAELLAARRLPLFAPL